MRTMFLLFTLFLTACQAITPAMIRPKGYTPTLVESLPLSTPTTNSRVSVPEQKDMAENVIFTFSRTGGFAGFCDRLTLYADGKVILTSCKGNRELHIQLSPEQLQQMHTWVDNFAAYEFRYADPPNVADGMAIAWSFAGRGSQPLDETTLQEMQDFLGTLLSKLYLP